MRLRAAIVPALAGLAAAAAIAWAPGASAAQTNMKLPPGLQIDVSGGSITCPDGSTGDVFITVQSGHDNINGTHENATIVGVAQLVDLTQTPPAVVLDNGRGEAWFTNNGGVPGQPKVGVDAVNAKIGGVNFHFQGTFVEDANGNIKVDRQFGTCH